MRLGTWNLRSYPRPTSPRGERIAVFLTEHAVDVWLLSEVSAVWAVEGSHVAVSASQPGMHVDHRLAGVQATVPLVPLTVDSDHPGEMGLCLVRLPLPEGGGTALVASSVLPWRSAQKYWPGLPAGTAEAFQFVLAHHVERMLAARQEGEVLVWGGDLNQELQRPFIAGTVAGEEHVRAALETLGLRVLTASGEHDVPGCSAIDHLAVPPSWEHSPVVVHRPSGQLTPLSDHAAYTVDVQPA